MKLCLFAHRVNFGVTYDIPNKHRLFPYTALPGFVPRQRQGIFSLLQRGTAVAQWLRCCATNRYVAGSIPAGVNGFFIDIKSFRSHYGPGVDSASNRNEYQEFSFSSFRRVLNVD